MHPHITVRREIPQYVCRLIVWLVYGSYLFLGRKSQRRFSRPTLLTFITWRCIIGPWIVDELHQGPLLNPTDTARINTFKWCDFKILRIHIFQLFWVPLTKDKARPGFNALAKRLNWDIKVGLPWVIMIEGPWDSPNQKSPRYCTSKINDVE